MCYNTSNSDDHCIYYRGQESLRRNGIVLIVNKSLKCSTWVESQKWQNDLSSFPRQTIQHHNNPSLWPYHWCCRSWSWPFLWRFTIASRTNTKMDVLFMIEDLNAKVGSQEKPRITDEFGLGVKNEAGQRLKEFYQKHIQVIANNLFQ